LSARSDSEVKTRYRAAVNRKKANGSRTAALDCLAR
jgi:hypothetical protein